jgi:hypothetical protein
MDKNRIFLRGAVVLFIVAVLVFSSVAIANTKSKTQLEIFGTGHGTGESSKGNVVWDNGMHYTALIASQWDVNTKLDPIGADDFQFEETTVVTDAHWIGGYWNPPEDGDFDWNVSFYTDRGDGMAPGAKIYEHVFLNSEVHETFIEDEDGQYWYFSYWVEFPEPITFTGGEKYWISYQGIGAFPPQSHISGHDKPVVLYSAKFKSDYFGYPDWTDVAEITGGPGDGCFQLTGDGDPVVADLDCDGDLNWVDVAPGGTLVNGTFTVINNGDFGSMLEWKAEFPEDWGKNWTLNWTFYEDGGFVGSSHPEEVYVEVIAPENKGDYEGEILLTNQDNNEDTCSISVSLSVPRSREISTSPILKIFQQFPNLLPILRQLFVLF